MQQTNKKRLAIIFAILGYSIFGFSLYFSKSALEITSPLVLLGARFTLAFIALNLLLLTGKFKLSFKGKNVKLLLLLGLFQPICYFICENFGVNILSTSIVGTMLALCPVMSVIFGFIFLKERVSAFQIIMSVMSFIGVFLTTLGGEESGFNPIGFALILGAVLAATMFNLLSRKIGESFSAFEKTYVMFALGAVFFLSVGLFSARNDFYNLVILPLQNFNFWIDVTYLAVISSVCAFFFINYSYSYQPIARISIFSNLTTVISIIAGILILKEPFSTYQIVGSCIVVCAVAFSNFFASRGKKKEIV